MPSRSARAASAASGESSNTAGRARRTAAAPRPIRAASPSAASLRRRRVGDHAAARTRRPSTPKGRVRARGAGWARAGSRARQRRRRPGPARRRRRARNAEPPTEAASARDPANMAQPQERASAPIDRRDAARNRRRRLDGPREHQLLAAGVLLRAHRANGREQPQTAAKSDSDPADPPGAVAADAQQVVRLAVEEPHRVVVAEGACANARRSAAVG